jgi:bifunctional pyridoxal-dependent enzyme with beta-cystathionase and maltose regulon repressor activities
MAGKPQGQMEPYDPDVLPAFVTDMDFAVAAPIQAAIERIVRDRCLFETMT